jgi:hypothetical protein
MGSMREYGQFNRFPQKPQSSIPFPLQQKTRSSIETYESNRTGYAIKIESGCLGTPSIQSILTERRNSSVIGLELSISER